MGGGGDAERKEESFDFGNFEAPKWFDFSNTEVYQEEDSWFHGRTHDLLGSEESVPDNTRAAQEPVLAEDGAPTVDISNEAGGEAEEGQERAEHGSKEVEGNADDVAVVESAAAAPEADGVADTEAEDAEGNVDDDVEVESADSEETQYQIEEEVEKDGTEVRSAGAVEESMHDLTGADDEGPLASAEQPEVMDAGKTHPRTTAKVWTGELTVPVDIHFNTDQRIRGVQVDASPIPVKETPKWTGELTVPQEFSFASATRSRAAAASEPASNTQGNQAKASAKYTKPTLTEPEEFHFSTAKRSARHLDSSVQPQTKRRKKSRKQHDHTKLTEPQTPNFHTTSRTRGSTESKTYKGLDLDEDVLAPAGAQGVPRLQKMELTNPKPFMFQTDTRVRSKGDEIEEDDPIAQWASEQKASKKEQELQATGTLGLTAPKTPQLITKARGTVKAQLLEEHERERERQMAVSPFKAGPIYVPKNQSLARVEQKPLTEPMTPNLETTQRGAVKEALLKEKVAQEERELTEKFNLRPALQKRDQNAEPQRGPKKLTKAKPFAFMTDVRGEAAAAEREREREREEAEARMKSKMERKRKRQAPSLTVPVEFSFETTGRARLRETVRQDVEAVEKKRKKKSHAPAHFGLTEPVTPKFHSDRRLRGRKNNLSTMQGGLF